jgi:hypothetical protein
MWLKTRIAARWSSVICAIILRTDRVVLGIGAIAHVQFHSFSVTWLNVIQHLASNFIKRSAFENFLHFGRAVKQDLHVLVLVKESRIDIGRIIWITAIQLYLTTAFRS